MTTALMCAPRIFAKFRFDPHMPMTVPPRYVHLVAAWLAKEGYTIMTAPRSLVAQAVAAVSGSL